MPEAQPQTQPMAQAAPMMPVPPSQDFGMQMPPMQPEPMPDLDFPEEPFPLDEEDTQKKKGLFGMFKR